MRDRLAEARPWVKQVLPSADSMPPRTRAELLWIELVSANEGGDNAAALAAAGRLAPLLAEIDDPPLEGTARLALAWIRPIGDDYEGAARGALDSLELLRSHDEPYWAGVAAVSLGLMEIAIGRYDDARGHLLECRELAERFDYDWLRSVSGTHLATISLTRGELDQARALLDEALGLIPAVHSMRNLSLILVAFARLALATRDPERAARLLGAATGIRDRVGFSPWPMLRRRERELRAETRAALGRDPFEEAFAAGTQLNQRDAIAAAREVHAAGVPAP